MSRSLAWIAERVYVPHLAPDFAYVHPRPEYGLEAVTASLRAAQAGTDDFARTAAADIERTLKQSPTSLLAFRLIVAFHCAGDGRSNSAGGGANQAEIATRFRLTVQPAPDFVVYGADDTPRALLECKAVNDGGTARDKAARFAVLRQAGERHGGIPVFAVIAGLGWRRTSDALGPVVQACDGRVFTVPTLPESLTVDPFPALCGLADQLGDQR